MLKENPDVQGNMDKIKRNKEDLCFKYEELCMELKTNHNFKEFKKYSEERLDGLLRLEQLKTEEKELNLAIKEINKNLKQEEVDFEAEVKLDLYYKL